MLSHCPRTSRLPLYFPPPVLDQASATANPSTLPSSLKRPHRTANHSRRELSAGTAANAALILSGVVVGRSDAGGGSASCRGATSSSISHAGPSVTGTR